jgi:tetratricopeptide (TPR) repeat protein
LKDDECIHRENAMRERGGSMRLGILISLLAVAVGITAWTAVHRHRETLWLRGYRDAKDSLQRGHYKDAEGQLRTILAENKLPGEHESALTMNLLAIVYKVQGRRKEAEPLFDQVIPIFAKEGASSDLDLGKACTNEGRMYLEEGRLEEAEHRLDQAIAIYKAKPDLAGAEYGAALHNMGLVRIGQKRVPEGQSLIEQANQIYAKYLSPDDLNLAQGYLDLAVAYRMGGRVEQAQEMDRNALKIQEKVFGVDSPTARETRARIEQKPESKPLQGARTAEKSATAAKPN